MTRTIIESKTRTTIIGFDQPFCVIGERINPTGRKILNEELERGDFSRVQSDAIAQVEAGATVLDVNSGAVFSNKMGEDPRYADNNFVEPMLMPELIRVVQEVTDCPICIDSSVPGALEAGLAAAHGPDHGAGLALGHHALDPPVIGPFGRPVLVGPGHLLQEKAVRRGKNHLERLLVDHFQHGGLATGVPPGIAAMAGLGIGEIGVVPELHVGRGVGSRPVH